MTDLSLADYARVLKPWTAAGSGDFAVGVKAVANDSRRVGPGTLFCAIRGVRIDGHQFLDDVVKKRRRRSRDLCRLVMVGAERFSGAESH